MDLADAGNVTVPAYLAISRKGYAVHRSGRFMIAENGEHRFLAEGPLQLLGLIALVEVRGESWQASDDEIDAYLARFES
ncbi:hypothetical protein VQ02_29335 [Methylobacterium variabile]|uniref:Uncharacterized protein n=1 Tax=Methylobacterium variabile TaxID=298794 RepID=A0A0J6S399_9HYPH|nr:hypothetical protein [Methylobacterium variabile]KMO29660.1 hypothetical protein VQ02_29335 [Methylobacterium variabile]